MLAKYTIAGLAASALLASVAFAQTPSATTTDRAGPPVSTTASETSSSFQGTWRASKLVGLSVYNESNESVGSISDLLTDKGGSIKAVVIGVGGFLGVGEHLVAVPLDKIKFVNEPIAYAAAAGSPNSGTPRPSTTSSATTTGAANTAPAAASKPNPWYPDHALFNATKDELKAMSQFTYTAN